MDKKVKFRTYEMIGSEIFKKEDFLSPKFKEGHDEIVVFENDKQYIHHKMALKNFTDIIIGEELVVPTLIGYANAKVISLNKKENEGCAETGDNIYMLSFNGDNRHCWTCYGMLSKKAIKRIDIEGEKKCQ
jgi:hypothetical protein